MPGEEELFQQRVAKVHNLRARGIEPYPPRFRRTHTNAEAIAAFEAWESDPSGDAPNATVAGRITALRRMGKAAFMDIRDGFARLQVAARLDNLGEEGFRLLKEDLDLGDIVGVEGPLFRTKTSEITVDARSLTILSKALQAPPEKWHGLTDVEQRYRQRYRDLISNAEVRELFRLRSRVVASVRRFLDDRGFIEVETPVLTDQAGGAAARPFITHLNTLDRELYMRIALELHLKRLVVGGFDRVYEIGRNFRNEGIDAQHNPDFTMLESYEAYADYNDVMAMVEQMVAHVATEVTGGTSVSFEDYRLDFTPPWTRLTLREALVRHLDLDIEAYADLDGLAGRMRELGLQPEAGASWGKLVDQTLKVLVRPKLIEPTFITDYPVEHSPLAKQKPDDPRYVERFEPVAGGVKFGNAYTELNDPLEQRRRFELQAGLRAAGDEEAELIDEDFLNALEHGMPPTGGLGIGIDHLVMLMSGRRSIREVILFPTLREKR
jgi:lysyl-tRNA synthetase class 2